MPQGRAVQDGDSAFTGRSRFDAAQLTRHDGSMDRPRPVRSVAFVAVAIASVLAACNDDGDGDRAEVVHSIAVTTAPATLANPTGGSQDAAAAMEICRALRAQANVRTDIANATVADVGEQTPEERYQTLFDGYDTAAEAERVFGESLADLDVPEIPERSDLLSEVADGADAAAAEFVDEQGRFADAVDGVVTDADWQGRVGEFFNSVEKANSLVEPAIARYDRRELQHAFLDEPECRYVIQQFVIDE